MNPSQREKPETACQLVVNGESVSIDSPTIPDVLARFGLTGKPVAVEVNRQLISRRHYGDVTLKDGDRVELVTLVGGG